MTEIIKEELIIVPRTFTLEESFTLLFKTNRLQQGMQAFIALGENPTELQTVAAISSGFEGHYEEFYPLLKELLIGCAYTQGTTGGTISALAFDTIYKNLPMQIISDGVKVLSHNLSAF